MRYFEKFLFCVGCVLLTAAVCGCARKSTGSATERVLAERHVTLRVDTVERIIREVSRDTVRITTRTAEARYDSIAPIVDSLNRVIGYDRWHFRTTTADNAIETVRLRTEIDSLRKRLALVQSDTVTSSEREREVVTVAAPRSWPSIALEALGVLALLGLLGCMSVRILAKFKIFR